MHPQRPLAPRYLLIIAVPEALVVAAVVVRGLVLGEAQLDRPLHLGWLVGTLLLATASLALFVVRAAAAQRSAAGTGEPMDVKVLLGPSLALLGLAAMFAVAGPRVFDLLGLGK